MKLSQHLLCADDDYFRVRNFLRAVFLLNERLEHSWNITRLDYWRWHLIKICQLNPPLEQVTVGWETETGELAVVLHLFGSGELRVHIHPHFRAAALEDEIFAYAEQQYPAETKNGKFIIAPVFADDILRREVLAARGFTQGPGWNHHDRRDLIAPLPAVPTPSGYHLRAMDIESEHSSRSWCSWHAFHSDKPDSSYAGDYTWYKNIQSAPLYRHNLDRVAATADDHIAGFCTINYDDYIRSAVTVLVGCCRRTLAA